MDDVRSGAYQLRIGGILPPASIGGILPPASIGGILPPASIGGILPPASIGGILPPASIGGILPPASIGGILPPASIGSILPPASIGSILPPASIGGILPPASIGGILPPASIGSILPPASIGGILPPPKVSCQPTHTTSPTLRIPMKRLLLLTLFVSFHTGLMAEEPAATEAGAQPPAVKQKAQDNAKWRTLFNGRDLTNWKSTNFGGEGEVKVNDKALILNMGSSLTGVTWAPADGTPPLPKNNYEIELEARRVEGNDFFCGLTFPYKETHASLVLGGWGGGVVGISCIDHYDASENDTTTYHNFKKNQWYKIRLRVTEGKFEAWIDNKQFVDVEFGTSEIGVRVEVELSRPLGVASFSTTAEIRDIRIRPVPEAEK